MLFSGRDAELTQLAAVALSLDKRFYRYILPEGSISKKAQEITGLSIEIYNEQRCLCHNGKKVQSFPLYNALDDFCAWLESVHQKQEPSVKNNKFILVGHNAQSFDMKHVVRAFTACNMQQWMLTLVDGFGDTLPLFRTIYKDEVSSFSQSTLCLEILNLRYGCHDAIEDTLALKILLEHTLTLNNTDGKLGDFCWSLQSIMKDMEYLDNQALHMNSLTVLFTGPSKVISRSMALKIAGSGLSYSHLKCVYERSGDAGLSVLLKSKINGRIRVTNRGKIIDAICTHFHKYLIVKL